MKSFEELFVELEGKVRDGQQGSATVELVGKGKHAVGKKLVEEAAEVWMAAVHEGPERTAEEASQLLYQVQVMLLANGLKLKDVYKYL